MRHARSKSGCSRHASRQANANRAAGCQPAVRGYAVGASGRRTAGAARSRKSLTVNRVAGGMPVAASGGMIPARVVLLVEPDAQCGRALARLLRRNGHRVRLVRTARAAAAAVQREDFDLAVVDLLLAGGGADLGRRLSRRVPRLYLTVGARLLPEEMVEVALGFPVLRKAAVPDLVRARFNGTGAPPKAPRSRVDRRRTTRSR